MPDKVLTVISLDAGFCNTGVVVTQYRPPSNTTPGDMNLPACWVVVHHSCITTAKESERRHIYATDDKVRRVREIYGPLRELMRSYSPSLIVAELPLSGGKSAAAHASMAMAITICACLSEEFLAPLRNYNWDDIKLAATNSRNAGKVEVQSAIARLYPDVARAYINPRKKTGYMDDMEHVSDALGAWLCARDCDVVKALIKQYEVSNG